MSKPKKGAYEILTPKYVGQSKNIDRRLEDHRRAGKYDPETDIVVRHGRLTRRGMRKLEKKLIEEHKPQLNKRAGGGGPK